MPDPKVRLYHPEWGWGTAYMRCDNPSPNNPDAPSVVMVRWDDSHKHGCAGCWVDPCEQGVVVEGAANLRSLPNREVGPLRPESWVRKRLGL